MVRRLATRIDENRKEDSPVGKHLRQCGNEGLSAGMSMEVIDQANTNVKLLTLEARHIWKEKPRINTCDEFRGKELTSKL